MRKVFAIVLLALFGLSFASPLLAQAGRCDMKLPACCRKASKHHCAAMDSMDGMQMDGMAMDETPSSSQDAAPHDHFSARMDCCGCCGFMVASAGHMTMLFVVSEGMTPLTPRSTRAGLAPQSTSLLQQTWQQSGNKRGPPATFLSGTA